MSRRTHRIARYVIASDDGLSAAYRNQRGHHADQRTFAAPLDQANEDLTIGDIERDAFDCFEIAIALTMFSTAMPHFSALRGLHVSSRHQFAFEYRLRRSFQYIAHTGLSMSSLSLTVLMSRLRRSHLAGFAKSASADFA